MGKLSEISNENKLNEINQNTYDKFNEFIFSDDLKLTGKLLHRFEYFLKVKDLPGDIVEIGVFKGSGISSFMKFIEIFCYIFLVFKFSKPPLPALHWRR